MQQIADWLQTLVSGNTFSVLSRTASALPSYPISPIKTSRILVCLLGHRRRLLRAIAELKGGEEGKLKPSVAAST